MASAPAINPFDAEEVYAPIGPFSHATSAGGFVFVSGTGGLDGDGRVISDDVVEQAEVMMENVGTILAERGLGFDDLAKVTLYLTDMDDYDRVNEVYEEYVPERPPARTCVEVSKLPARERVKLEAVAVEAQDP